MAENIVLYSEDNIKNRIQTIRGVQVMLDSDLAEFYSVETKVLNQAVKRNSERFPQEFMFQLTADEYDILRSQTVTLNLKSQIVTSSWGGKRKKPFAFTEQGVAMLSAVLRSETAIKMSIQIINAFVAFRHFLITNAQVFQRLDSLEIKQLKTDNKIDEIFNALESSQLQPKQGIFFDGQVFDAYKFVCDIIRKAKKSIVVIDNYIDESVLEILTKRNDNVTATIFTKSISKQLKLDLEKHNKQYPGIEIKVFEKSHDRFMIIDENIIYHIGASLKDLGKKWFAFSKMDKEALEMLSLLEEVNNE